jgi:hypothetical protein
LSDLTRSPRLRAAMLACATIAALGVCPTNASAQFNFVGPGSTPQGDIARGQGVFLMGAGLFNLNTAMADSINVDTAIRWNQYVYLSIKEDLHEKYVRKQLKRQFNITMQREMAERLRNNPDQADLRNGDALNTVLKELLDPRISPSNYRRSVVPLPGDVIRKIPFNSASTMSTFSMDRLIGKKDWPLALRGEAFEKERRKYEKAIDTAINQDVEGKLSREAVVAVETAIQDLDDKIEKTIPQSRVDDYKQAKLFARALSDNPRMLRERVVERVIAAIETYAGTSVGDLVMFMQKYNLRFGVAGNPTENELYAGLFDNLRQQRDQVGIPPEKENAEEVK